MWRKEEISFKVCKTLKCSCSRKAETGEREKENLGVSFLEIIKLQNYRFSLTNVMEIRNAFLSHIYMYKIQISSTCNFSFPFTSFPFLFFLLCEGWSHLIFAQHPRGKIMLHACMFVSLCAYVCVCVSVHHLNLKYMPASTDKHTQTQTKSEETNVMWRRNVNVTAFNMSLRLSIKIESVKRWTWRRKECGAMTTFFLFTFSYWIKQKFFICYTHHGMDESERKKREREREK